MGFFDFVSRSDANNVLYSSTLDAPSVDGPIQFINVGESVSLELPVSLEIGRALVNHELPGVKVRTKHYNPEDQEGYTIHIDTRVTRKLHIVQPDRPYEDGSFAGLVCRWSTITVQAETEEGEQALLWLETGLQPEWV